MRNFTGFPPISTDENNRFSTYDDTNAHLLQPLAGSRICEVLLHVYFISSYLNLSLCHMYRLIMYNVIINFVYRLLMEYLYLCNQ